MAFMDPRLFALALTLSAAGCSPPPELTAAEEKAVARCLELAFRQEADSECKQAVTKPMEKAFLAKHPEFHERLVAERKKFIEERIAEDVRRRDALNLCLDQREAGAAAPSACQEFMSHEIERGLTDRKLRRCAAARIDGDADANQHCSELSAREIDGEIDMERSRRERAKQEPQQ